MEKQQKTKEIKKDTALKIKGTLDDVLKVAVKGNPKPKKKFKK